MLPEIEQRLSKIRARLEATTPGKWLYGRHGRTVVANNDDHKAFVAIAELRSRISDGDFLAHAPGDMKFLLDLVNPKE